MLLAWESEALLLQHGFAKGQIEIVVPSSSILAEPPVALVDKVVDSHGTRALAQAYLEFLYSDEGQEIAAKNFYRPTVEAAAAKHRAEFPTLKLFTVDERFGGWKQAQAKHFDDGGQFDQLYLSGK